MATAKKYPEFELPALVLETVKEYLGTARMSKLTAAQRTRIAEIMQQAAGAVGKVLEIDVKTIQIIEAARPD